MKFFIIFLGGEVGILLRLKEVGGILPTFSMNRLFNAYVPMLLEECDKYDIFNIIESRLAKEAQQFINDEELWDIPTEDLFEWSYDKFEYNYVDDIIKKFISLLNKTVYYDSIQDGISIHELIFVLQLRHRKYKMLDEFETETDIQYLLNLGLELSEKNN